jgi:uncharacterized protein (DUF2267 family)
MSMTGLPVFDTTVQKTNQWLADIGSELGWDSRHKCYQALRGVLHVLRDHLPIDEAAQLGSQLPMLVRGFYFEGWHPAGKPMKDHSVEKFLIDVANHFPKDSEADPETITRAVFAVMAQHIPGGEIEGLIHVLPRHIRELWFERVAVE